MTRYKLDRRPGVWLNTCAAKVTETNKLGLNNPLLNEVTARPWVRDHLARGDRHVWRMSGPIPPKKPFHPKKAISSSVWEAWDTAGFDWLRKMMYEEIAYWKSAQEGRTWDLYTSVRSALSIWQQDMTGSELSPDVNHLASVSPWLTLGGRLWLDNASTAEHRDNALEYAEWLKTGVGVDVGIEAFIISPDGDLDHRVLKDVPMMALSRFTEDRNPEHDWTVREDQEAIVIASSHHPLSDSEIENYRERGFVMFSGNRGYDDVIFG
jgi:hypothetical protein